MIVIQKEKANIVHVKKEITIKNTEKFRQLVEGVVTDVKPYIIIDLSNVVYLNSSALGIIAHAAMNAKKNDKELVIAGIQPPISEIFEIVKFDTFMSLFQTLEEAEQYFESK
ncbi:STAS domain-containing protein [Alkalihalobacterium bogoriense]|uniref:STAS domain-containing protein n=1 Tax=Alkalihalobacterium bogoriense TaxID=246272 RepID=UPI000684E180|nr:STAS domain-containing protein [Alkalihalobacterium bogoriense]